MKKLKDDKRLKRARKLRAEAEKLEKEAFRNIPYKWKVGHRVRFLRNKEWKWSKGQEATIIDFKEGYSSRRGHEYQVFYTSPDNSDAVWWTTPDDVELIHVE